VGTLAPQHPAENVDKRLTVALELAPGKDAPLDLEPLRQRILDRLKEL
jgi:hypothetical protein